MSLYPEYFANTKDPIIKTASISDDGLYRYTLQRRWGREPCLPFVMLNPSTADATYDDPTIKRCVGFAQRLGYGGTHVVNLFAFRATQPSDMLKASDPVGPDNDAVLRHIALGCAVRRYGRDERIPLIAAWGNNAPQERVAEVMAIPFVSEILHSLGVTNSGAPKHPLARGTSWIPNDAQPVRWPAQRVAQ